MSVAPSTPSELARTAAEKTIGTPAALLADAVRASAFWTAALLPFSYLPLLATGAVTEYPLTFVALLAVNAAALLLGHGHDA
jgi:hypothetical protein